MKQKIGSELDGELLIEKSPKIFPVPTWTRVGDKRHLFETAFPLSDLVDPPCGRRARPLHVIIGTLYDTEMNGPAYWLMLEKFASEGICAGRWCKRILDVDVDDPD